MGPVLLTAKAEPAKAEPAINWAEIESRLQEISAPAARAGDRAAETSLPLEPSAPDPTLADEPPAPRNQPVSIPGDPLEILSSPSDGAVSLSPHQEILAEFQAAIAVSTSSNRLTR